MPRLYFLDELRFGSSESCAHFLRFQMDVQAQVLLADGTFATIPEAGGHLSLCKSRESASQLNRGRFGYRRMQAMRKEGTFLEIKCLCDNAGDTVEG